MVESHSNPEIDSLLTQHIAARDFPSAVYSVFEKGRLVFSNALGNATLAPRQIPANLDTIFDLASLTKPLVTGFLCALLYERAALKIDNPVSRYLRLFDTADKREITVRQLLTHTSGLPAWRPLREITAGNADSALDAVSRENLICQPGEKVVYSDLGFITLGKLIESVSSCKIDELAQREIFDRLRLRRTFFKPNAALRPEVAASETGDAYEREMWVQAGLTNGIDALRSDIIWGEVHDGNAYFLGGAAGHAGLFSTALETAKIAEQFITGRSTVFSNNICELFRRNLTEGLQEDRSFAWQLASTKDSTAGLDLPPDSFGHNGFTGTCCWIDGNKERIYTLLTNRTHQRPLPLANINSVRRRFNSIAASALNS
jgi:CubicO group peptidase (beta-lactamase class C family)